MFTHPGMKHCGQQAKFGILARGKARIISAMVMFAQHVLDLDRNKLGVGPAIPISKDFHSQVAPRHHLSVVASSAGGDFFGVQNEIGG